MNKKKKKKTQSRLLIAGLVLTIALMGLVGLSQVGKAQSLEDDTLLRDIVSLLMRLAPADDGMLGGTIYNRILEFTAGFTIGDTTVFDSSRNLTAVDGTFSDDVAITDDFAVSGETNVEGFTQGGGCTASTTVAATELWTEADLLGARCFEYNGATAAAITITLPATSTMTTLIPNAGDSRKWLYQGYTVAATTTTWTAGTGIDMIGYTTDDDVIDGNEFAELTMTRMIDTDITLIVSELVHTD